MRVPGLLLATLALSIGSAAGSAVANDAMLNAVAYRPIPPGTAITVRPLDNSDDNLVLQKEIERELEANGYRIATDSPLVLSFESQDVAGAWTDEGLRTVIELKDNQNRDGQDPPQVNLNIYNSSRGGLLNKGRSSGTAIVTPSQVRLDAVIDDRGNGERVWQAWATAALKQSDSLGLSQAMVPFVIGSLGSTVKNQPFAVR